MIKYKGGEFEMMVMDGFTPVLTRKALCAYECPWCFELIYGLMEMEGREKTKVRKEFRKDSLDAACIDLKRFYGNKTQYYTPPAFDIVPLRTVSGQVGQMFRDHHHFGTAKKSETGSCRVTRAVRLKHAYDLGGVIEAVHSFHPKQDTSLFQRVKQALEEHQSLNIACWHLVSSKVRQVSDLCGREPDLTLLSNWDWHKYDVFTAMNQIDQELRNRQTF
jgi:hypothetical protein